MTEEQKTEPRLPFFRRISPVAFALLALLGIFLLYQSLGNIAVLILTKGRLTEDTVTIVRWTTIAGQILLMLVPTLLLARARYGSLLRPLRIGLPGPLEIVIVVLATLALQQIAQGYMMLQDAIPIPDPFRKYVELFRHAIEQAYRLVAQANDPVEFVFVVFAVALVPAVSEEFLFRGLVQQSLAETAGGFRAAVIAGVIFGAYHLNPFSIVPLVLLGVFFGYIVYRSGNVLLAVTAHFINNFVACAALYLRLTEDSILLQPEGGAEPGTVLLNIAAAGTVFILLMFLFNHVTTRKEAGPGNA